MDNPYHALAEMLLSIPEADLEEGDYHRIISVHEYYVMREQLREEAGDDLETTELRQEIERREGLEELLRRVPIHMRPSPEDSSTRHQALRTRAETREERSRLREIWRQQGIERLRAAEAESERRVAAVLALQEDLTEEVGLIKIRLRERTISKLLAATTVHPLMEDEIDCIICREALGAQAGAKPHEAARLPCKHIFGTECVTQWLKTNKTCPMCRREYEQELKDESALTQAEQETIEDILAIIELRQGIALDENRSR